MSGSRKLQFLVLSVSIHVLAVVVIAFLANSSEQVYENIEVTSYVTPVAKTNESKPATKQEKPKIEKLNPQTAEEDASNSKNPSADIAHQDIVEELAKDSEITTPAVLLTKTKANRTEAARKADFSGISQVELVVGQDGQVQSVKLRNSLPYGLDEVALNLAKESKFKPAMVDNKPVASAILFKVRFESEK
ncbi:MAG: energy transducer TonB [Bdellovibrionota bacterium]